MKVILDTNFIISCLKRKIDFGEELHNLGFKILIPKEVIEELKDLRKDVGHNTRSLIDIGLEIIENENFEKIKLGGKNVDFGLIKKGKEFYIATLDSAIKNKVPNKIIISDAQNCLEVIRD